MKDRLQTQQCKMHEALVAFLYNEASPEEAATVQAHLNGCAACKDELDAFERVRGMLQQWQTDEAPVLRVETQPARRPVLALLCELFGIAPIWTRSLAAALSIVFVLAILGTEISVGQGGMTLRFGMLQKDRPATVSTSTPGQDQIRTVVAEMIAESRERQRAEFDEQLADLERAIENSHSSELARLAQRIREQRAKLDSLERDFDRREGLDLTNILFSSRGLEEGQ
jgi:hypothetical protein